MTKKGEKETRMSKQSPLRMAWAQVQAVANFTLLEARRNRLIWLLFLVIFTGIGLSGFLSEMAVTESRQIQIALLASFMRFSAVFLIAVFVVTSMVREFNDKGVDLLLALPLPRAVYLFGKLSGFAVLAAIIAILFSLPPLFFAPPAKILLWAISLTGELWIVAAFSLLCVVSFTQVTTSLSAVLFFYLLSRSISAIQLISSRGPLPSGSLSQTVIDSFVNFIAVFLPRLDDFTRTDWLVYHRGDWTSLEIPLAQTFIYLVLLTGAAMFDFYRKEL